jgi:hypothetical protein
VSAFICRTLHSELIVFCLVEMCDSVPGAVFSALRANAAAVELARVANLCLQQRVLQLADESQKSEICLCVASALSLLHAPVDVQAKQQASGSVHAPSRLLDKAEQSRQEALNALQKVLEERPELRVAVAAHGKHAGSR